VVPEQHDELAAGARIDVAVHRGVGPRQMQLLCIAYMVRRSELEEIGMRQVQGSRVRRRQRRKQRTPKSEKNKQIQLTAQNDQPR
jgi:hypothetical protein